MSHLSHMMGLPVEAADALTDLWAWLGARVRCKQKNQKWSVWNGCLCVWHDGLSCRYWEQCCGFLVPWWNGLLLPCVVVKIKRRWIKLIWCFRVTPDRAFCSNFVLLSLTSLTPVICWSFWFTSIKRNADCTPAARMGAFKHLVCMQRSLMHPGLGLL